MALKVVTPPNQEPVSLEEAKLNARADDIEEDPRFQSWITSARRVAEVFTRRALATTTFEYTLDRFPPDRFIKLPRPPLQSVDSVTYKDKAGNLNTLDPSVYAVDTDSEPGQIVLFPDQQWPSFEPFPTNAVRIRYTAGYVPAEMPEEIKNAMLMLITYWYENREVAYVGSVSHKADFAFDSLLWPYRVWY